MSVIFNSQNARPRDTKRREDKGELGLRNLLRLCYRDAKGLRYFPIYPEEFGTTLENKQPALPPGRRSHFTNANRFQSGACSRELIIPAK
jgi:hypothetical protein